MRGWEATTAARISPLTGIASAPFLNFIKSHNIEIKSQSIFEDHCEYSAQSIKELQNSINESGANSIITTEKDLVKLPEEFLKQYKVYIVKMNIVFEDDTFYNQIFKDIENC